ncbi:MAG: DUF4278 domain-containing protein [Leptolyngbyaceae bacterium]|nr:DUF4278 domain-containing protein [Leptolyngbyaceae bacterium]
MKLNFRGTAYATPDCAIATPELSLSGTYRGQSVSFKSAISAAPEAGVSLHYRGVAYLR